MTPSAEPRPQARVILVMGVAGSGKSTIGAKLAETLGWEFRDADEFHPPANVAKMASGIPLTDLDRKPWLEAIHAYITERLAKHQNAIVSCSALKGQYRQLLETDREGVSLVYLHGDYDLILKRLKSRPGHFFKDGLLQSQFEALEPPQGAISIDVALTPEKIVAKIRSEVGV